MRKTLLVVFSAVCLVAAGQVLAAQRGHGGGRQAGGHGARAPGAGHHHGYAGGYRGWYGGYWGPRVGFYYGWPGYWGAGWPLGWGYGYYPYAGAYAYSPLVVNAAPQEYIQQEPVPAVPSQDTAASSYWYYCTEPAGYFPYVRNCSQPWLKVVPQAPGEESSAPRLAP